MSIRSMIGLKTGKTTCLSIYCHSNGWPAHNGAILLSAYDTEDKVRVLLGLGDLSRLGPELGEKRDFNDRTHPEWCLAYGRDRGDRQHTAAVHGDCAEGMRTHYADYGYVFDPATGSWQITSDGRIFMPLTEHPDLAKPDAEPIPPPGVQTDATLPKEMTLRVRKVPNAATSAGTVEPVVTDIDRAVAEAAMLALPCDDYGYCEGCPLHKPGLERDCGERGDTAACNAQHKRHKDKCAKRVAGVLAPERERAARIKDALAAVLYDACEGCVNADGGYDCEPPGHNRCENLRAARAALGEDDDEAH